MNDGTTTYRLRISREYIHCFLIRNQSISFSLFYFIALISLVLHTILQLNWAIFHKNWVASIVFMCVNANSAYLFAVF